MSSVFTLKLKWNKSSYSFEFDVSSGDVATLKAIIFGLTSVPPDRQKLMAKGAWVGTLKDDTDFSKISFKPDLLITLMGTADVIAEPTESIRFVEDMSDNQKANLGLTTSAGLDNLGNTCYLNATIQCFRNMPELRNAMTAVSNNINSSNQFESVSSALKMTFQSLDGSGTSVTPFAFVNQLRRNFPQFAERLAHIYISIAGIYIHKYLLYNFKC